MTGPLREWFAVYGRLIRTPKFRRLSDADQLSLLYVWALAGDESPEATWRSARDLDDLLVLHGRPEGTVGRLAAAGWIDEAPDGGVMAHDWDDHQMAATKAARNEWEAKYMRGWRRTKKENTPSSVEHNTTQHRSEQPVDNALFTGEREEPYDEKVKQAQRRRGLPVDTVVEAPLSKGLLS